ncbi:MAG: DUF1573 domain-containing protein [Candidatus Hydrogenedens sp.]
MRIRKVQYIIFGIVLLCSLFVFWLVIKSQNQAHDDKIIENPYNPSLPPIGSNPDNTAIIELETGSVLDLGTVPNDKETTRKVKVFNRGKSVLNLKDIRTTCACTIGTIPIGQNTIPPDGEGYFLVTLYPTRVAGFVSEKTLTIFSNDFKNPVIELKVIAKIEPEFICEPEVIDFGTFTKGDVVERKLHITQKSMNKPLIINKVYEMDIQDVVDNDLNMEIIQTKSEEPVEYIVLIKINPNVSPGEFVRKLFLSTNIDRFPEVPIKVKGIATAPYKINPSFPKPFIVFPRISKEMPGLQRIEIIPQSESNKIELVSYEINPDYFIAQEVSISNTPGIKIEVVPKILEKELMAVLKLNIRINNTEYHDHVLLKTLSSIH